MNCPHCTSPQPRNRPSKRRWAIGRSAAQIASEPSTNVDEVRQFFRVRTTMKQKVSLALQREVFHHRLEALSAMVLVA